MKPESQLVYQEAVVTIIIRPGKRARLNWSGDSEQNTQEILTDGVQILREHGDLS